jgi:hypothetical protein
MGRELSSRLIVALIACAVAAQVYAAQVHAAEVIHSFDSVAQLAKDGTLTVTETLRVRAEGRDIRHGIYRDFPLAFRGADGRIHQVGFKLLEVMRDGKAEAYHTENYTNGIRIYAGSKDTYVSTGDHSYVLKYTTDRQVRWFNGKPELNWNVTGNFWRFPIVTASYKLELTNDLRPARWLAFTGPRGARGTDWSSGIDPFGALTVTTTRLLPPGSGLTVVALLPAGAVDAPTAQDEFWWSVRDNMNWIIGIAGFIVVGLYYFCTWSAVGRDPKRGVIIPLFHPPQGISPALANYIHNWGFSREKWRAFTAAALSLAVKGLVLFDDKDKTLVLRATGKTPAEALPAGEEAIFLSVRAEGGQLEVDKTHGPVVAKAGDVFTKSIEAENRNRFFHRNLGYNVLGIALTAVTIGVLFVFGHLQPNDVGVLIASIFGGIFLGVFILPVVTGLFRGAGFAPLFKIVVGVIFLAAFGGSSLSGLASTFHGGLSDAAPAAWTYAVGNPFPFLLVGSFAALNGLFFYLMRAPTAFGRPVMDQLDGFRLYLTTAETPRLNMEVPEITSDRFEALLPYAVALDAEKPWSSAFEAALRKAHPDDSDPTGRYRPGWRTGSWSGGSFSNAVSSSVSAASSAFAASVPASSGSSGFGGGSGGGGGGGGGGGW